MQNFLVDRYCDMKRTKDSKLVEEVGSGLLQGGAAADWTHLCRVHVQRSHTFDESDTVVPQVPQLHLLPPALPAPDTTPTSLLPYFPGACAVCGAQGVHDTLHGRGVVGVPRELWGPRVRGQGTILGGLGPACAVGQLMLCIGVWMGLLLGGLELGKLWPVTKDTVTPGHAVLSLAAGTPHATGWVPCAAITTSSRPLRGTTRC